WTVRAGVEQFWRDTPANRTHPYVAMVLNPTNAWAVSVEGVGGASATAGVQFEPSLNLQLAAGYTAYAHDTAPALQAPALRSAWGVTGFLRPIPASGFFFLGGQFGGTRTATGGTTTARLGASVQAHDVRLVPFVRLLRDAPAGGVATTSPFAEHGPQCRARSGCAGTWSSNSTARCRPSSCSPRGRSGPACGSRWAWASCTAVPARPSRLRCRVTSRRCGR